MPSRRRVRDDTEDGGGLSEGDAEETSAGGVCSAGGGGEGLAEDDLADVVYGEASGDEDGEDKGDEDGEDEGDKESDEEDNNDLAAPPAQRQRTLSSEHEEEEEVIEVFGELGVWSSRPGSMPCDSSVEDDLRAEARYEAMAAEGGDLNGALEAPAQPDDAMSVHEIGEDEEEEQESLDGSPEDGAEGEAAVLASDHGGRGGDGEPLGEEPLERPVRRQRTIPLNMDVPGIGRRPENLPAPVDRLSRRPTLTKFVEQEGPFYGDKASFNRIYGNRCIANVRYEVPEDGDGLHQFLQTEFGGMLKDAVANESLWSEQAKPHLANICRIANILQDHTPKITLELPQLSHCADQHNLELHDKHAVQVINGAICTGGGDKFCPLHVGSKVPREENGFVLSDSGADGSINTACVKFDWVCDAIELTTTDTCAPKLTISSGIAGVEPCEKHTFDAPPDMAELLKPDTWPCRRVKDARREHATIDKLKLDTFDKLKVLCICNLDNSDLVAEVMRILSSGRFRSSVRQTPRDQFELSACGANGFWDIDAGKAAWHSMATELQANLSQLSSNPDFENLISELNDQGKLENVVSITDIKDHLHGVCRGMKDSLGLMKPIEKTYASFVRLVQDQNFEYDALRQINFSNGYCYDVATKATRRIRPSDGAKLCTGYPYPEFDANKDAELEVFLEEVHPDPDVRRFRISELAKCLNMAQNEPCVRFCFGTAGAGKGITTRLFLKAVGDYGGEFDKSLFARPRDGGENATPARLQLKNKVYVVVNEVAGFDSSTLKQWCGSDQIVARALYGQPVKFFGTFNLTEMTFNDMISIKKDEGLERRCCAIRFSSQFVSCADEQGAMAAQQQWERDGEESKFAMHDQKYERIMALAPQLMARLIRIHQAGDYAPRYPDMVEQWNAELWAESAPENPLQLPISQWFTRCGCMPRDTADDTTCDLVDVNGNQCTHSIQAKDIMPKLKAKKLPNGDTLYKQVKGRGRSDEPVLAMLQRVHLGSPALRLACVERRGEERNVFFGLKHAGNAFQRIMPAGAGGQFED